MPNGINEDNKKFHDVKPETTMQDGEKGALTFTPSAVHARPWKHWRKGDRAHADNSDGDY